MHRLLFVLIFGICATTAQAADWHIERVNAPARINAIETVAGEARVNAGGLWYKLAAAGDTLSLAFIDTPAQPRLPEGALLDGKVATGAGDIARAWLAEPTTRYDHGILGDKIEAGSLVIETRNGKRQTVRLNTDAVFEDLEPRIVDLDRDGHNEIVVVKSYLKRGSSLAVVAQRRGKYEIVAETPPLGAAHRWLDPAGIADFNGDGKIDIALVRQPHVIGSLELWSWGGGALRKSPSCLTSPITSPARARSTWSPLPTSTATASPTLPRLRLIAARPAHRQLRGRPARDRQRSAASEGRNQSRAGRAK